MVSLVCLLSLPSHLLSCACRGGSELARQKHYFSHHSWISLCLHITELHVHIQRSLVSCISQKKAEFSLPTLVYMQLLTQTRWCRTL